MELHYVVLTGGKKVKQRVDDGENDDDAWSMAAGLIGSCHVCMYVCMYV